MLNNTIPSFPGGNSTIYESPLSGLRNLIPYFPAKVFYTFKLLSVVFL